jgi:hypothetical protein
VSIGEQLGAKRGAPIPLRDEQLVAPRHMSAAAKQAWAEAVASRPGWFTSADLPFLEAYALAVAFIRDCHRGNIEATPKQYANAIQSMRTLGKDLRISAYGRAREGSDRVAPPAAATDPRNPDHALSRDGPATAPWRRSNGAAAVAHDWNAHTEEGHA